MLSCLKKWKVEASDGSVLADINSAVTNPQIKQYLKVADSIAAPRKEDEEEFNFIATKDCLEFEQEKARYDLTSQNIHIPIIENASADAAYLTSVTSLVARLPAFDHVEHNKLAYLRIKSDEIVLADHVASGT